MCGSKAPDPPDYSQIAAANEYAADLAFEYANDQLDWAKQVDTENRTTLNRVLDTILPIQKETHEQAKQDREYLISTFRPLEKQLVAEAQAYDTPARREKEAGAAASEVAQTYDQQRKASEQRLRSYGIDPSQGAYAALQRGSAIEVAAEQAGASRTARNRVEDVGRALRADAVNLGRGLPSSIAASYGTSINSGNAATQGATNITNAGTSARASGASYLNAGTNALSNWGNTLNMGYQNQLAAYEAESQSDAGFWGGVGSIAGLAASFMADGGEVGAVSGVIRGRGDGSGVDDAIRTKAKKGSFILPKDVVDTVGVSALDQMTGKKGRKSSAKREPVTINVSDGEYAVEPAAVKDIGKDKLQSLIDAFHVPVMSRSAIRG